jgi:single-strand DNA-binding protein
MNSINITGNLTADAIIRGTDKKVANFTVAVRGMKEHTDFIRCTAFGKTAEYLEKYGKKGAKAAVGGSLHISSYEKDGNKIPTAEIYVNNVELFNNNKPADKEDSAPVDGFVEMPDDDEVLPFN